MVYWLVFFAGCTVGSLATTAAIALCVAAKIGDIPMRDGQQQWRDSVRRLLREQRTGSA
jgi:hypothetical protein